MPLSKPVPFSLVRAGDEQISAWYDLNTHCRRDVLPEDPDISLPSLLSRAKALEGVQIIKEWAVWSTDNRKMLALGGIHASKFGFNKGSAFFDIMTMRDHRRQGLGESFLGLIADTAKGHEWKF